LIILIVFYSCSNSYFYVTYSVACRPVRKQRPLLGNSFLTTEQQKGNGVFCAVHVLML
jgi:hypothetical protein